jgi:predicted alpha/beta superfamily hydrolase
MNRLLRWTMGLLLLLGSGCAVQTASDAEVADPPVQQRTPDPLFGLGTRDTFVMSSGLIGRDFHVLVRLPRSYSESDRNYPMVLLLDGGILFPMLAPYQLMMEAEGSADELIVVGVSYGGLGFSNGNYRSTDYTAPSDQVEYFGGAALYQSFLASELLPRLEREYRIDASQRVVLGQSLGGQFAIHSALTRPELFSTFIAVNPALQANLDVFMTLEAEPSERVRTLVMAMGSEDPPRYRESAVQWLDDRLTRPAAGLKIDVIGLPDGHHATSAPAAYHAVIRRLFPPAPAPAAD